MGRPQDDGNCRGGGHAATGGFFLTSTVAADATAPNSCFGCRRIDDPAAVLRKSSRYLSILVR